MEFTNEILDRAAALAPVIRMLALSDGRGIVRFLGEGEARGENVLTLSATDDDTVKSEYARFRDGHGAPDTVYADGIGAFALVDTTSRTGRLAGKITIVTGGAQGFGKGIAEAMTEEGAYVAIADMNYDGALKTASELDGAIAVRANVSDEQSVAEMVRDTVLRYGGLDVFVNNAG
ncbi:MAG: SDR family NAD(P)-dependent oxidoreductase, partial [Clostridia bacterium]|nr:SDR family NAD(P)-dependent oxidoreductase [Clostridia bacterium]